MFPIDALSSFGACRGLPAHRGIEKTCCHALAASDPGWLASLFVAARGVPFGRLLVCS